MTSHFRLVGFAGLVLAACAARRAPVPTRGPTPSPAAAASLEAPLEPIEPTVDTLHGRVVPDPFRWLEDGQDERVVAWGRAQDSLARQRLDALPGRDAFLERLKSLRVPSLRGVPQVRGDRWFFKQRDPNTGRSDVVVRTHGVERKVLDSGALVAPLVLGSFTASPDGRRLAYFASPNDADRGVVHVRDVDTGAESQADVIEGIERTLPSWTPDSTRFVYTFIPSDVPHAERNAHEEVREHVLGRPQREDAVVVPRRQDRDGLGVSARVSFDGRYLLVERPRSATLVDYTVTRRVRGAKEVHLARDGEHILEVEIVGDDAILLVNGTTPRGSVVRVSLVGGGQPTTLIAEPAEPDEILEHARVIGDRLVLTYLKRGEPRFEVRRRDGSLVRVHRFPPGGAGTLIGAQGQKESFSWFSGVVAPAEVEVIDIDAGAAKPWSRQDIGLDPNAFIAERRHARSKDGTDVPFVVVRRRDGAGKPTPTWLLGYGGFGISQFPVYRDDIVPWLERGGAYVVAQLRGGFEGGESWHADGARQKKQRVFDDFIAIAEALVSTGVTTPKQLVIEGNSNGGLLVAAVTNQRPDLFAGVLCREPLTDMIRFAQFGRGGIAEYGDPAQPDDFRALLAYSPYHNVRKDMPYPKVLVTAAWKDERVNALHARKLVAMLRSRGVDALLRVDWDGGHVATTATDPVLARKADALAFAASAAHL